MFRSIPRAMQYESKHPVSVQQQQEWLASQRPAAQSWMVPVFGMAPRDDEVQDEKMRLAVASLQFETLARAAQVADSFVARCTLAASGQDRLVEM
jgi:hypothetical protein